MNSSKDNIKVVFYEPPYKGLRFTHISVGDITLFADSVPEGLCIENIFNNRLFFRLLLVGERLAILKNFLSGRITVEYEVRKLEELMNG